MRPLNPLLATDFYKTGHFNQYPDRTQFVFSNFTPRSAKIATDNNIVLDDFDNRVVFVGLQGFLLTFLIEAFDEGFFKRPKHDVLAEYKATMDNALGVDAVPTDHLAQLHDLGYMPLKIMALPEGSRVNIGVPMYTVINTHSDYYWLVNYIETVISAETWKTCTTATIAYEYKRLLTKYARKTGAPEDFVPLQGHDFSFRGMSGWHDAASTGIGHLAAGFIGTDTVAAIEYAKRYYYAAPRHEPIGVSVPATEHSVATLNISLYEKEIEEGQHSELIQIFESFKN